MIRVIRGAFVIAAFLICAIPASAQKKKKKPLPKKKDNSTLIDPFIGTQGKGHHSPGAVLPYGLAQASPVTSLSGNDYRYTDSLVYGFSNIRAAVNDTTLQGEIIFTPTTGEPKLKPADNSSVFLKKSQKASAGYYATELEKYKIEVELTATQRATIQQYDFGSATQGNVIVNLQQGPEVANAWVEVVNNNEIRGYRLSKNKRQVYFYTKFSKTFSTYGIAADDVLQEGKNKTEGKNIKLYVQFNTPGEVLVTTGLSHVSAEGALNNLQAEIPEVDFKRLQKAAKTAWQTALNNILVEGGAPPKPAQAIPASVYSAYGYGYGGGSPGKKVELPDFALLKQTAFITAMYHTMLTPAVANDADGKYHVNDKTGEAKDFTFYDIEGFDNEFSARYALLTLTDSKRVVDIIKSYLATPVTDSAANALAPLIVDAYAKGIKDFDAEQAYNKMKTIANSDADGRDGYRKLGYVPANVWGSVTKTIKYAYQDWCIAQMAAMLNKPQEQAEYLQRAQNWKNLLNSKTNFLQARVNGEFPGNFDAAANTAPYSGGTAWQHVLAVPYDVEGLTAAIGGKDKLEEKLDEIISAEFQEQGTTLTTFNYYVPYLYAFTNNPQKVQNYLARLLRRFPAMADGLPDNDRQGQTSAWYALNCLGLYNIAPGQSLFNIGLPQFDKTVLWLNNSNIFTLLNSGASLGRQNIYIQGLNIDEKDYSKLYINYDDIARGGDFEVFTGTLPNKLVMQALEKPVIKVDKK